jgi:hypothetical protein
VSAYGSPGRYVHTNRRFETSIDQLTAESIKESLEQIERALERRFGVEHLEPEQAKSTLEAS